MGRKIGILTHWNVPNYGTFLQAYALRNVIQKLCPEDEVYQIAYIEKLHIKMYYSIEIHEIFKIWIFNPKFYKDLVLRVLNREDIKLRKKFLNYYDKEIKHSDNFNKIALEKEKYDIVVLGSDILWDYSIKFYNQDQYVFGNRINADKIISYAASFGTVKRGMKHPDYVESGLKRLSAISVRDENSSIIINDICNIKPEIVLDPSLFWDFFHDVNIPKLKIKYKYIVVYGSVFPDKMKKDIYNYTRKNNIKIIVLDSGGDDKHWCDKFIRLGEINPFEWCAYFREAEFIVTCTFHGLMFGLVYNKKIIFNPTSFVLDKALSFIHEVGLSENLIHCTSFYEKMNADWDYNVINHKIELLNNRSKAFIKNNILSKKGEVRL